jgi:hypothetical protein
MSDRTIPLSVLSLIVSLMSWVGVSLSPLGTSATIYPSGRTPDDDESLAVGGMRIDRGNRSTRGKLAPLQHDLIWDRTRTAAMGNQLLTA